MIEKFLAWTWGLPEYAQFFFWLAVIFGALTLCGIALKMHDCWTRKSLLDRRAGKPRWGAPWRRWGMTQKEWER